MKIIISHSKMGVKRFTVKAQKAAMNTGVNCNIIPQKSVVFNKEKNKFQSENSLILDVFDMENNSKNIFGLFMELRKQTKINCAWVETENYSGCITQHPEVIGEAQKRGITCSEYNI